MTEAPLHLFAAYGIELEYMMVDITNLNVLPISNNVLRRLANEKVMQVEIGEIAWSNELVMHVIELKSNGPKGDLTKMHHDFHQAIVSLQKDLLAFGAKLLPSAMHPLFDPKSETRLWSDEDAVIYNTYNRIFNCQGHGWANLQSIHINLPFSGDEEFGKLHAAVRVVLPLLAPIAASSPYVEGKRGPYLDSRLFYYMQNQKRVRSIIGNIIPERAYTKKEYEEIILNPMYEDIRKFDTDEVLKGEWLNSRAAIARFMRNAIEVRLLDIGECLRSDFAIIKAVVSLIKKVTEETWCDISLAKEISEEPLKTIMLQGIEKGLPSMITDMAYLAIFGINKPISVGDFWAKVAGTFTDQTFLDSKKDFEFILEKGSLGARLVKALGETPSKKNLMATYHDLSRCLIEDKFFGS